MSMEARIHFLFGMSRAGITWLSRRLNVHPEIAVFGQSRFWGKRFVQPVASAGYNAEELRRIHQVLRGFDWNATVGAGPGSLRNLDLAGFHALLDGVFARVSPPLPPAELFRAIALAVAEREGKRLVIEKTPHHVLHAKRIAAAFPQARFIVLCCGPADFIRVQRAQPDLPYHPIGAALLWRRYALAGEAVARRFPERTVMVRFDELLARPEPALARVYAALGVAPQVMESDAPPCRDCVSAGIDAPPRPEDLFWMRRLCGGLIARLGEPEPKGQATVGPALLSAASFPLWAFGNLRVNLREVEGSLVGYYRNWLRADGE